MISRLFVYPVKGAQGVERKVARLDSHGGLEYDRWFCVVDEQGTKFQQLEFLNQRKMPQLASLRCRIRGNDLIISGQQFEGASQTPEPLVVPLEEEAYADSPTVPVGCGGASTTASGGWHLGTIQGKSCGEKASEWLTQYFSNFSDLQDDSAQTPTKFGLVRCLGLQSRNIDKYAGPTQAPFHDDIKLQKAGGASPFKFQALDIQSADRVRFHDCMPLLVASENSFMDLEQKMGLDHYPLQCFRPNVVVEGFAPWSEWRWTNMRIRSGKSGQVSFRMMKPCARCTVPARNPKTGKWMLEKNKMLAQKTLGNMFPKFLHDDEWGEQWQGPCFGVHAAHSGGASTLCVGDSVQVSSVYESTILQSLMQAVIWGVDHWKLALVVWAVATAFLLQQSA